MPDGAMAGQLGHPGRPDAAPRTAASTPPVSAPMAANVVDIRRFSTHDGSGIRTTIFLKGCSLECAWCQNPETIEPRLGPVFFRTRCIDCDRCVDVATAGEAYRDAQGHVQVDVTVPSAGWLALVDACPTGAIAINGTRYTIEELVDIAVRDRVFFGASGGVTLSGGEPLFLPHFAAALLAALQAEGIHTALETALNVRTEFVMEALEHCDHVLADCKLIDSVAHATYVGSPNALILRNLGHLLTSDRRADVTVRTPLIPGITATEANIRGIAEYLSGIYPDVRYELLNYNPLAAAKYDLLPGRRYLFDKQTQPPRYSAEQMAAFRDVARSGGVRNVVE